MYWHELIQELEIIPAWECFLSGVMLGIILTLVIIVIGGNGK